MTNGEALGTSGGTAGTSGWRVPWAPVAAIAVVGSLIAVINATSGIMEAQTGGPQVDPREPWVWEISSVILVVLLAPLVAWVVWRVPPPVGGAAAAWGRFLGLHLIAACAFSVMHVAGMVAIREAAYAVAGWDYDFAFNGDLTLPFIYELRKDLLTYAANALAFWAWSVWQTHKAAQAAFTATAVAGSVDSRIEVRNGARVTMIDPVEVTWIEAAGNYVEIHVGGAMHLARGTLAGFETLLAGRGFVRVHRSRLVNRARVRALKSTASGDFEVTLDDGRTLAGSRRYRAAMDRG